MPQKILGKKRSRPTVHRTIVEDGELLRIDKSGCEVPSDDEDDNGEDLKDFIVDDEEDADPEPVLQSPAVVSAANVISGKRQRKPVQRYIDTPEYKKQYEMVMRKAFEKEQKELAAEADEENGEEEEEGAVLDPTQPPPLETVPDTTTDTADTDDAEDQEEDEDEDEDDDAVAEEDEEEYDPSEDEDELSEEEEEETEDEEYDDTEDE